MTSAELRRVWLRAIATGAGMSDQDKREVGDQLARFANLFDNPADLVREAFAPIETLLNNHRQTQLRDDVLMTFASATPYPIARAWALVNVGDSRVAADDYEGAITVLSDARNMFRELHDDEGLAKALIHLADIVRFTNPRSLMEFDVAIVHGGADPVDVGAHPIALYQEALTLSKNKFRRQRAGVSLADVYLMAGQVDAAAAVCQEAMSLSLHHDDIAQRRWMISECLNLAMRFQQLSRPDVCHEIASACRRLCETLEVGVSWRSGFEERIDELMRE
jgi:hypothetical protein